MSEGTLKPEKDFSKEVDEQLPQAEKLASVSFIAFITLWSRILANLNDRATSKVPSRSSPRSRNKHARYAEPSGKLMYPR